MNLQIGDKAPDFSLPDQDNTLHSLSGYQGQWILLYFYPKDDTPGCTAEACGIRDQFADFDKLNLKVFGISADSVDSHKTFAEKYSLPFILLADENKEVIKQYGVWGKKSSGIEGILRTSFLINPEGKIAKIYEKVEPEIHAQQVLADLEELK